MALIYLGKAAHYPALPPVTDLGAHTLHVTQEQPLTIEIADSTAREMVYLDSDEAYKLT